MFAMRQTFSLPVRWRKQSPILRSAYPRRRRIEYIFLASRRVPSKDHCAGIWFEKARHQSENGGFPATAWADEDGGLPRSNIERDTIERKLSAVRFCHTVPSESILNATSGWDLKKEVPSIRGQVENREVVPCVGPRRVQTQAARRRLVANSATSYL